MSEPKNCWVPYIVPLEHIPKGLESQIKDLISAMKEQTKSNLELAASIRLQADAIADLAEAVTAQQDEGDEPEGLGHLGTL